MQCNARVTHRPPCRVLLPQNTVHCAVDVDTELALLEGAQLLKVGRKGKPRGRKFWISADLQMLHWKSRWKRATLTCISLRSVERVVPGQVTASFQRLPEYLPQSHLSFSLILKNRRTLDLICRDGEQ